MKVKVTNTKQILDTTKEIIFLDPIEIVRETKRIVSESGELISTNVSTYLQNNKIDKGVIIGLFGSDLREKRRNDVIFESDFFKYNDDVPFDRLIELGDDWDKEFELLIYAKNSFFDLLGKELPRSVEFDHIKGLDNYNFEIEGLLEHLKNIPSAHVDKITKIPYYNATDERNKEIIFRISPTDEEWEEILLTNIGSNSVFINELENKFAEYYGLNKFLKVHNDEDEEGLENE